MEKTAASTFSVLGMHRSGTSALTRSINILGPRTSDSLMDANSFNTTGYWEPKSIVKFNDDVMSYFNRHWADPKPFPKGWTTSATFNSYAAEAKQLLDEEFSHTGSIVFKDPRFSRVLPVWRDAIEERNAAPVYLIACRNPMEVAQSLAQRDKLGIEHGLQLWLSYMLEAERSTRGMRREVIHYEELLRDWRSALRPVFQYAGMPAFEAMGEHRLEAIGMFLNPDARHQVASRSDFHSNQKVSSIVKRSYDLFLHFSEAQDTTEFDQISTEWHAFWGQHSPGNDRSAYVDLIPKVQFAKSRDLEREGRIIEAVALVKLAIATANDNAQYQCRLGILSEKLNDLSGATIALRRAVTLDATPARYHVALARVLGKQGDREQAITILRAALLQHPEHALMHYNLGVFLEQIDDLSRATTALRRAISLDNTPAQYHVALARVLGK